MNFDDITLEDARRSQSRKWTRYGNDVIPSWIADMDFPVAKPIQEFLYDLGDSGSLCYVPPPPEDPVYEVFSERMSRLYGWTPSVGQMDHLTDIVQAISIALKVLVNDDEQVIVSMPSYHPILTACQDLGREILPDRLVPATSGWELDFERLENSITARTRALLLINPHNPTGKVYSRFELEILADIALQHNLYVISDEVHCDLSYPGYGPHIPFASLGPDIAKRTVTFNSATKSYNLGSVRFCVVHYGSDEIRKKFLRVPQGMRGGINALGPRVTRIAWQQCDDWLDYTRGYLAGNNSFLAGFVSAEMPEVKYIPNQATYLAWLDLRKLDLAEDPADLLLEKAKVAVYSGSIFGKEGDGYIRLNFATSRQILEEKLTRIRDALLLS